MRWRKWLILLHRDIGFLCVGLTAVYAISGVAVNHREHWDYNYSHGFQLTPVGTPSQILGEAPAPKEAQNQLAQRQRDRLVAKLRAKLGRKEKPRKVFWRGPDRLSLFFGQSDQDLVDYLPSKGVVQHQAKKPRPLIRQLNFLHLNEGHGWWTYVADLYAVLLLFLAISGAIVVKGRKGLWGRGGVYVALGIVLPFAAYLLLR